MNRIKTITMSIICLVILINISYSNEKNTELNSTDQNIPEILLKKISVNFNEISFEEALTIIAGKGNFKLNYNRDRIPINQIVSLKAKNVKIIEVLNFLTEITNTKIKIISDTEIAIVMLKNQLLRKGKIRGFVLDKATKTPLIGVNVSIDKTSMGSVTDEEGWFSIENVPVGSYTVQFDYIGYKRIFKTDIIVRSKRTTTIEAEIKEEIIEGEEINVTSGYFHDTGEQFVSASNYSAEEIRRAVTVGGDISRIINGLPSVSNENESNQIIVRGGSPVENSFYVDNVRMNNINHFPFPGSSGGFVSFLNIDFIKDVNLYSGGFSSEFGNSLSSVMDIKYREGNRDELDLQFDLNFTGLSGAIEGPLKEGNGSYLFSAKHSFTDILFKIINENEEPVIYDELQTKIVYDLSSNHKLSLLNIFSDDRYKVKKNTAYEDSKNWYGKFNVFQNVFGINWQYLWGKKGYSQTSVSHSYQGNDIDFKQTKDDQALGDNKTNKQEFRIRNSNYYQMSTMHNINFGFETSYIIDHFDDFFDVNYDFLGNPTPIMSINKIIKHTWMSSFFNYNLNITPRLFISSGIRLDHYSYNSNFHVSPRLSVKYQIGMNSSLSFSTGIFYQQAPMYFISQKEEFKKLNDPKSHHFILGFSHLLAPDTRLSVEVYDKEYDNIPLNPNQPQLFILDEVIYNFFYSKHDQLVDRGKGYSRGIELLIQKKLSNKFYGIVSGTYYRSRYKDLNGDWRNRVTDNRYLITVEGGFKPNHKWEFNISWKYAGGIPYSLFDQNRSLALRSGVYDTDHIMTERLKDYSNLSIRMDRRFHFKNSNLIFYLCVWNVLNVENISYYNWIKNEDGAGYYVLWPILPVFGFEFEF